MGRIHGEGEFMRDSQLGGRRMIYTKLKEKTDKPSFEYVVLIDDGFGGIAQDYYLFNYDEFEQAYKILKKEAIRDADTWSVICEVKFNNYDRTYSLRPTFKVRNGKIVYDKYQDELLHVLWHIKAGKWLNPRNDV